MIGLESTMDNAQNARKTKKPEVDSAERERQMKFTEQLRNERYKGDPGLREKEKWKVE